MKKKILFIIILLFCFIGCLQYMGKIYKKSENHISDKIKYYSMKTQEDSVVVPTIQLNVEEKTFCISYDVLSSVITGGTYEIINGVLIAKTDDGQKQYLFEEIDENVLRFIQDGSSKIELTDERIGVRISDGAEFILEN